MTLPNAITRSVARARRKLQRRTAILWQYAYGVKCRFTKIKLRCNGILVFAFFLLLVSIIPFLFSAYVFPVVQANLDAYYATDKAIEGLRDLLLSVGGALIGATAIVTSLVLFAMQVNIERMPHGLFRRLSTDRKLLGAFAIAFVLAVGVAVLSTFTEPSTSAQVLISAAEATTFILVLFWYAYRRALVLINPLQQLEILIHDTCRVMRLWDRRARRAKALFEREESVIAAKSSMDSTHDLARTRYFESNGHWIDGAMRGIRHAMSFARRYAEQGDYEVSDAAWNAVVTINAEYIKAKGKTFYASPPFMEDPRSRDTLINDTLESVRQNLQMGITRRDERQIEQLLRAIAELAHLYHDIDYSSPYATKDHAHLAAEYLASAVQTVVPHDMVDVLLQGERLMGRCAQRFIAYGNAKDIAILSDKIATIACTGCAKEEYRPVTMEGMAQLANLTFDLFFSKSGNTRFAIREVRWRVAMVSKMFLKVPDTPQSSTHSYYLGPYYSAMSQQSLMVRLMVLVNALSQEQADNTDAQLIIRNMERWADGLYQTTKELLLGAIATRSYFTSDMILWITNVTKILLGVSGAPACNRNRQGELLKHARLLIGTLTWIPDDKESMRFVENFELTEALFGAAMDARNRDFDDISKEIGKSLLSWSFKGAGHLAEWGVLDRGLCACAVYLR